MAQKNHRLCVSCRKVVHRNQLWRVVRTAPDRTAAKYKVQLDTGMGRSAYLCPTAKCLELAQKKNRLGRLLRSPVPEEIFQRLEHRLKDAIKEPDKQ